MKALRRKKIIKNSVISSTKEVGFWELLRRFFVVWFLMFFCALLITQQESFWIKVSNSPEEVVFVLPWTAKDWSMDTPSWMHSAADSWSYLFEDENINEESENVQWSSNSSQNIPLPEKDSFPFEENILSDDSLSWVVSLSWTTTLSWNSENPLILSSWVVSFWTDMVKEPSICITPWWEYVAHKDFVLAYEQRKDVTNLCNVQKRYCNDWKLTGSYPQKSCKEHTLYSYVRPEAVSYAQKPIDPFIQPQAPSLSWANFDLHGKIDTSTTPRDVWWSPSSGRPSENNSVSQTLSKDKICVTPWWEQVKNGQFVKAYKTSVGLIDVPCEVELRLCVSGSLKWTYTQRTCTFKKMTYRDYVVQNYDITVPTVGDLINTVAPEEKEISYNSRSFWKWLDKYF